MTNIHENVSQAEENINQGTLSLIKASSSAFVPITCAAVGGAIFGPVGAIVGFKLSTGVISAIGGSAATYYLAKFVQDKNKKESVQDLETISQSAKTEK